MINKQAHAVWAEALGVQLGDADATAPGFLRHSTSLCQAPWLDAFHELPATN